MRPLPPDPPPTRRGDLFARRVGSVFKSAWVVAVAASLAGVGCKQIGKLTTPDKEQDLLEAELRTREREVLELRAENQQLKQLADIYQRQGYPTVASVVPGPVVIGSTGGVISHPAVPPDAPILRQVSLGTGTGGRDDDGLPGDETLQVVIVPKDADGAGVKAPGRATVAAYEITEQGQKLPIGKWEVTGEQLRKTWRSGLIGNGYFVPLQWDRAPATDRVRVVVRFFAADGREFEADKDVTVKPLPGLAPRSALPSALPATTPPTFTPGPAVEVLPAPGSLAPRPSTVLPPPGFSDTPIK